jgi:hypothetical protein
MAQRMNFGQRCPVKEKKRKIKTGKFPLGKSSPLEIIELMFNLLDSAILTKLMPILLRKNP